MTENNAKTVQISIVVFLLIMTLLITFSIITCNREKTVSEVDKAKLILDSICISMNEYFSENGSFPDFVKQDQSYNEFAPVLNIESGFVTSSSFRTEDIILSAISHKDGKFTIKIRLTDGSFIEIDENSSFSATLTVSSQ